jgi:chemotaxis signal transduction protein
MIDEPRQGTRADELRREFDRMFAEPPETRASDLVDLLLIGVAGHAHAVHLAEVAHLCADKKVVEVPTGDRALMGIAAFRGELVPIYDLRSLLGYPMAADPPRWIVLTRRSARRAGPGAALPTAGLAFDEFERIVRVPQTDLASALSASGRLHVRQTVRVLDLPRPIISLASIHDAIEGGPRSIGSLGELVP